MGPRTTPNDTRGRAFRLDPSSNFPSVIRVFESWCLSAHDQSREGNRLVLVSPLPSHKRWRLEHCWRGSGATARNADVSGAQPAISSTVTTRLRAASSCGCAASKPATISALQGLHLEHEPLARAPAPWPPACCSISRTRASGNLRHHSPPGRMCSRESFLGPRLVRLGHHRAEDVDGR